jgi:hypothetical protein
MLEDAKKEIYFASRYHDPYVSRKMFEKVEKGVTVHFLDGNPAQISVQSRLNAILRTPPDEETFRAVNRLIRSRSFQLRYLEPATIAGDNNTIPKFNSFLVVDGNQVIYENINYGNPEEFTVLLLGTTTRIWQNNLLNIGNCSQKMPWCLSCWKMQCRCN